ncbi:CBU_0592 family membrane protein [Pedobacter sp. 22163]|uniref:CBU_0592 family membrane protein n=1 Tax=Pedobacter sp. 22163 TaxID=3453883 RepID=UPI003F88000D
MMNLVMSIIGWSGVLFCTMGYLFLSMKLIRADSLAFQALNILGGLCLAITALDTHDLPNAAANVLWMSIGLYALSRQFSKREQKQP